MANDQIADFLTRLRNAGRARLSKVDTMNTKMNRALAEILVQEGYVKNFKEVADGNHSNLRVYLKFEDGDLKKPVIQGIRRVSRPGLRKYVNSDKLPRVQSGFGLAIISSSKGVITGGQAKKMGIGGEHVCSVW
jgi:small subunit ribosomal protein S8